jgi:hypothetical protein
MNLLSAFSKYTNWARLTYDYDLNSLLVEMPSAIHEAPFDCLKLALRFRPYFSDDSHEFIIERQSKISYA